MPDTTPILQLPYILPSQAQKHVTHNEAIRVLDVLVQLAVTARNISVPPVSPAQGDRYIVAAGASGAWAGKVGQIALYENGAWQFFAPMLGWSAWVTSEQVLASYNSTAWVSQADGPFNVGQLGISATPDVTNRLSVSAPATLLNHAGAGHQLKLNKAAATDTASLLFQTGFSGRAEMGTAGSDDFAIKVSADGSAFLTGLSIASATGQVTLPAALRLGGQASDPVSPPDGTIWLNSTTGEVKMRSGGATVVIATAGAGVSDGDKGDITVSGTGAVWTIDAGSVTNTKLASAPTGTFKGRTAAGTGAVADISAADAVSILPYFTSTSRGVVPPSGGGTTSYLRADGTWAAPAGGGGGGIGSLADLGVTATAAELNALDGVTSAGSALIVAANAAAQRSALGLGTAALAATGTASGEVALLGAGGVFAPAVLGRGGTTYALLPTTGSSFGVTGIPAGVKQVSILWRNVGVAANVLPSIQLGHSAGFVTSGYAGAYWVASGTNNTVSSASVTTSFQLYWSTGLRGFGRIDLDLVDDANNIWNIAGSVHLGAAIVTTVMGQVALPAALSRVNFLAATSTFSANSGYKLEWRL